MKTASTLWIIHRDAHQRAALARIAGAGDNTYLGGPSDELFASASAADIVLLAPSGDFETELEFVHRYGPKLPGSKWILLPEAQDLAEAQRLFDTLPATFLRFPPHAKQLRKSIAATENRRGGDSLSRRGIRDRLAARFACWFTGYDMPDLLRALDPRLSHLPLLVRGEPGTGRGLVARYVHAFGGAEAAELLHVPCAGLGSERELLDFVREAGSIAGDNRRTLWLEDVDKLPTAVQLRVRDWVEYGLPEALLRTTRVRFIATAENDFDPDPDHSAALAPALAESLAGMMVALPALRDRSGCIETFIADTAIAWSNRQGERQRVFGEAAIRELANYPWPGNMAQLEAVIFRSLSHSSANPIDTHHLRFQSESPLVVEAPPAQADYADSYVDDYVAQPPLAQSVTAPIARPADASRPARPREFKDVIEELGDDGRNISEDTVRNATPGSSLQATPEDDARTTTEPPFITGEPISEPIVTLTDELEATPTADSSATFSLSTSLLTPPATPSAVPALDESGLQRLVGALAHEVRNPLVSIKTFSELLPDHYADEEFRERFAQLVGADVRQIEGVVTRLQALSDLTAGNRAPTNLPDIVERILGTHSETIADRHILVLKELDRNQPFVLANGEQLEGAFAGMFDAALAMVPERGDVYVATKHNSQAIEGTAAVRLLLRYHNPTLGRPLGDLLADDNFRIEGITPSETSLEFLIAEAIIKAQGGSMTLDATDAQETVIVVDLPSATP